MLVENPAPSRPEQLRSDRWMALALFLLSFLYLCLFRRYTTIEPDEGIVLQGAQRILRGQVLYRDFFSFLTPGSFYLHALLFRLFGSSFLVPRTALAFMGGGYSAIGYLLARRVCSRWSALLAVTLLTLTTLPYRFLTLHNWDSTLLCCVALYCAVRAYESQHRGWMFAVGSCASLTTLFEQSKGAGLCLGLVLALAALWRSDSFNRGRKPFLWLAAGLLWPFLLTLVYFASQHAIVAMMADWLWPLQHYSTANRVRYGFMGWSEESRYRLWETGSWKVRLFMLFVLSPTFLAPALPLIAAALFCYWTYQSFRKQAPPEQAAYYCIVCGVLTGLLLSIVAGRADVLHFMYLQPLYGLLLAWIFDGRDIPGRLFKRVQPALTALLALAFVVFAMPLLLRAMNLPYRIETRRGVIKMPAEDTVLAYTQARVTPGNSLLVYPYLPLYNYFTATFSPTPYDFFQPGMNTPEEGDRILGELKSGSISVVLFEPQFQEKIPSSWPGTPPVAIAQDPIADYIVRNYRKCQILHSPEAWKFWFMVRKDDACPSESL